MEIQPIKELFQSLCITSPMLVLLLSGLAVLTADVFLRPGYRWILSLMTLIGVGAAFLALQIRGSGTATAFFGALQFNSMTFIAHNVILVSSIFIVFISSRYWIMRQMPQGEYHAMFLFATMGMLALASSADLLSLFINFEIVSISLYVLVGMEQRNLRSTEASFKYFVTGSVSAAVLLLGIAFIFGATGAISYSVILDMIKDGTVYNNIFLMLGFGLLFAGFCFKLTLPPFHMYAPDVYEGAPTPVAALIATGSKIAGFAALAQIIEIVAQWNLASSGLWHAMYFIAVVGMLIGTVGAVIQPGIKRMLAYSSIAHSAYMLIPLVIVLRYRDFQEEGFRALEYYFVAYSLMTLLAFGVIITLGRNIGRKIADYTALGCRAPGLALLMALAMISLIGIPPTVGFFGKFRLFATAVHGNHIGLAIFGLLASTASAFYYLRVIVTMYMTDKKDSSESKYTTNNILTSDIAMVDGVNYVLLGIGAACLFIFAICPWIN